MARSRTQDLFDHRIERAALRALNAKEMPLQTSTFHFTVIAHDIHDALQVRGHGVFGNIAGPCFPGRGHALLTDDGFLTNGTAIIKTSEFTKAMRVNGMTARQVLGRLTRGEHIFSADGTIVFVFVFEALMRLKDGDGNAHAAFIAVSKGFYSTDPTKSTLYTMKRLFGLEKHQQKEEMRR